MDYGHLRGVKTYVTMNTLMEEKDLYPALRQAEKYRIMGADALIIQDLGLGRLIRNELPDMPIHLSTQAGACDPEGVAAAVRLGYERVVLARELTFEEIKATVATGVEIEVFVHGGIVPVLFWPVPTEPLHRRPLRQQRHLRPALPPAVCRKTGRKIPAQPQRHVPDRGNRRSV